MALSLVTAPVAEPLTLAEAKRQVRREDVTTDDTYLLDLISVVRQRAELETRRQVISATWDWKLDRFPCDATEALIVPLSPLQEVTAITYIDSDGDTQTWAEDQYLVDAPAGPKAARGRITPAYGVSWPSTQDRINAVTIRFVAGYGDTGVAVPPRLKMGMLEDLGTLYEHREDFIVGQGYSISEFPQGSRSIYASFRSY